MAGDSVNITISIQSNGKQIENLKYFVPYTEKPGILTLSESLREAKQATNDLLTKLIQDTSVDENEKNVDDSVEDDSDNDEEESDESNINKLPVVKKLKPN